MGHAKWVLAGEGVGRRGVHQCRRSRQRRANLSPAWDPPAAVRRGAPHRVPLPPRGAAATLGLRCRRAATAAAPPPADPFRQQRRVTWRMAGTLPSPRAVGHRPP